MTTGSLTITNNANRDITGVAFMIASEALLATVNAIIKLVHAWPAEWLMAVRFTVDFLLCMLVCYAFRLSPASPMIAAKLVVRGISYTAFISCLWAGLRSCLPLGDVVVVIVAVSPLFLVILTYLLLDEKIPRMWPLQATLCVTGALLVNKPLAPAPGCPAAVALLPVGAAFFGALMNFVSRNVKDVPPPVVMAFNDLVAVAFASIVIAVKNGSENPDATFVPDLDKSFGMVMIAAVIGWVGLMCNVKGYQTVSVAAVASIAGYISVPLGYVLQVFVFNEVPDVWSIMGASLILCTNVTVTLSKVRAAKAVAKDQDNEYYTALSSTPKAIQGA